MKHLYSFPVFIMRKGLIREKHLRTYNELLNICGLDFDNFVDDVIYQDFMDEVHPKAKVKFVTQYTGLIQPKIDLYIQEPKGE